MDGQDNRILIKKLVNDPVIADDELPYVGPSRLGDFAARLRKRFEPVGRLKDTSSEQLSRHGRVTCDEKAYRVQVV